MRTRLRHAWETATTGYWFLPAVMMVGAAGLAMLLLAVDRTALTADRRFGWFYAGGADGAMTLLSTVAGSVITVAGVVFSITIAALTQASSQFGPRLLRNFMRDRGNQLVLGTFVATFVYCLLVLRTIHSEFEYGPAFVPQASVTAAVLLAGASIGVLIYFIHHVSISLQAPMVVAAVGEELEAVIKRLSSDQLGAADPAHDAPESELPLGFAAGARAVEAERQGYVQAVDYQGLTSIAAEADVVLRLAHRPGDYVIRGTPLLWVWPAARGGAALGARLNAAFICGRQATPEQDVEHGVRQLVEIAVRALSPGINDPFTAINCIDALGSALCRAAGAGLPGPLRFDEAGVLRLVTPATTFAGLTDTAFNAIRQYGRDSVPVTIRLLETITACAGQLVTDDQRGALLRHAEMVAAPAATGSAIPEPSDRADVARRLAAARRALTGPAPVAAPAGR